MSLAALLLLADSRLPSGGHVHSGGVEALVDRGLLTTVDDLVGFLDARIGTAGLCAASAAAAAALLSARRSPEWRGWDHAVDVRTPSAALREVSRAQGVALLRTVRLAWPDFEPLRVLAQLPSAHHPLVLGAAVTAANVTPEQAAALAVHHMVGGAATAAVRLLGLDPLRVAAAQAVLAPRIDRATAEAVASAEAAVAVNDPDLLPADATPLPEILAELHHASEVTLFAS